MSTRKLRRKYRPVSREKLVSGKSRIIKRTLAYRREIDAQKKWYALRANPGREHRAMLGLRALGADIFRAIEDRWQVHKSWCSDISRNWFPPYIFVGFDGTAPFEAIRNTHGVSGIVKMDGSPLEVHPDVLQSVADQLAGVRKMAPAPFKEGQDVLVAAGPFAELRGIVEEADEQSGRASVAIEMFGKTHVQELDFVDLKAA